MSTLNKWLSKVSQRNKDLIMGYFRNQEKILLLLSHCPEAIKYLCLMYVIVKKDEFVNPKSSDESGDKSRVNIESYEVQIKSGAPESFGIWGENACSKKGIHTWTFKIGKWANAYNKIGISDASNESWNDGYSLMVTPLLEWQNIDDDNDDTYDEYEKKPQIEHEMKNDDIMKMELNCYDWTLSFEFINDDLKQEEYIKRENIVPKEYRLKIYLATECEVCYQLLDYQMTY